MELTMTGRSGLSLLSVLLAGCVSIGNSDVAREQTMSQIQVGETTRQQVMNLLGDPDSRMTIDVAGFTREWWLYTYESAVINPLDYMLLYGLFFNGIGLYDTRYDVGVFFDHRGVVNSLSQTRTDFDMGRPFTSLQVLSVTNKTIGSGLAQKAVHFEDRMEYRYENTVE
jgi:outer membrane protein assembly factor BamE (lipoprotein component of BamABCDE complex)